MGLTLMGISSIALGGAMPSIVPDSTGLFSSVKALMVVQTEPSSPDSNDNTFGPFGLFDHRSQYGTGFFPEPFLVDEGDLDREIAFKWIHQEGHGTVSDDASAEIEYSFGEATIEIEAPYERTTSPGIDGTTGLPRIDREEGIGSPSVTLRHPIWQFVSDDEKIDNTLVAGVEVAVPVNSPVSKDTEVVPEIFDLLRLGDHFGLQTHVGLSTLFGSETNNLQTLEYSADFSYGIDKSTLPLPNGILGLVPMFEVAATRGLNQGNYEDNITGVIGGRINLDAIGPFSPRLGIGYIFPIDKHAGEDFRWGVVTSLVFDF